MHVLDADTLLCTDETLPENPPEGFRQNLVHKNTYHRIVPTLPQPEVVQAPEVSRKHNIMSTIRPGADTL